MLQASLRSIYAGISSSPHVLTAAMPPKNSASPVTTLIFPGNLSDAKISSRKNAAILDSLGSGSEPRAPL